MKESKTIECGYDCLVQDFSTYGNILSRGRRRRRRGGGGGEGEEEGRGRRRGGGGGGEGEEGRGRRGGGGGGEGWSHVIVQPQLAQVVYSICSISGMSYVHFNSMYSTFTFTV